METCLLLPLSMMICLVSTCDSYHLSGKMFLDMSEARITSISHLIVKIDKQFGEIKKQFTKLADLDMKNYFVLGRSEQKLIMKSLTNDYDSSYLLTI